MNIAPAFVSTRRNRLNLDATAERQSRRLIDRPRRAGTLGKQRGLDSVVLGDVSEVDEGKVHISDFAARKPSGSGDAEDVIKGTAGFLSGGPRLISAVGSHR